MNSRPVKFSLILALALVFSSDAYSQDYFVTDVEGRTQALAISVGSRFGDIRAGDNYNLLATLLGDSPDAQLGVGQRLIDPVPLTMSGINFTLQPFVFRAAGSNRMKNLPPGPKFKKFIADPLSGEKFDLTLPFNDPHVELSNRSAFMRLGNDGISTDYHTAIDFQRSDNNSRNFDILAAADGIVLSNSLAGQPIVLLHKTPGGKEFITIYQHLDIASKRQHADNSIIKRGDKIGTTDQVDGKTHLHFAVAVKGPSGTVGGVFIPEFWYLIDPFGVYDFRKNRSDPVNYNYVPDNTLAKKVQGIKNAFVFMTNPISGSLFFGNEDCIPFVPDKLTINSNSSVFKLDSESSTVREFPNFEEASKALQVIKKYGYSKACYIGRPNPSFEYFKP